MNENLKRPEITGIKIELEVNALGVLEISKPIYMNLAVLCSATLSLVKWFSKCGLSTTGGIQYPFRGSVSQSYFVTILKHNLPFSFSFSHECTVEYSRGYMTCGTATD